MKTQKVVGIWIRVSTEDQAKGESPEHHEARARVYAEWKGWNVKEVYNLAGWSGKSVIDHPEAKRMMADVKRQHITGLIFSKLARLARNTKELLDFADYFQEQQADLISLQENIDTSSPAGRLFYTLIAAMAQWEREEIADRVRASIPIRAKMGKSIGGTAPYGYMLKDQKLVLNPKEAPIRKLMFELFLQYKRRLTVAQELNKRGYRTRKGKPFSDRSIDRLLKDPIAKGLRRMNYSRSPGRNKAWKFKPQEEWIFVPAPAIVSEELWNQVNQIIDEQFKPRKTGKRVAHIFSGYVYCTCGEKMYAKTNHPKYNCVKCKNRIGTEDLEEIFREQLKAFIISPEQISTELRKVNASIQNKEELLLQLDKDKKEHQAKIDTLLELVQKGEIPQDGFKNYYNPVYERLQQINEQIPRLQGEIDAIKVQLASSNQILIEAQDLYAKWSELSFHQRRSIVETVVNQVIIDKEDISFELAYLPTFSELSEKVDTPMSLRIL